MEHCCVVKKISVVGLQIFIFLRYDTAVLTISVVSPPVDHTQLHFLRLPVVVVYDFTSSLSSLTSSPSLHLFVLVIFAFISVSSSWSSSRSSPSRRLGRLCRLCLRHHLVAGFSFALHVGNSPWIVALVLFYFALLCLS
ncbi:hypothetical protein OUZ56_004026 [Daphnia magna]|uniref:Transmembrane protein n=1 Tax=Daphnia magna TaxID=35525 RepID=A0ABQ9YNI7_9CRUS|nr:hypothetical protein OUZ56_004026 [Daphnia magna]